MLNATVWPDCWASWCLFVELSGQWRVRGIDAQPTALDYTPLFMRMERMRLDDDTWRQMFDDVRVCEAAALAQMRLNQA